MRASGGRSRGRGRDAGAREQQHVDGIGHEATAECYALQKAPAVARALGVADAGADQIAQFTYDVFGEEDGYPSRQCKSGGKLDLHLRSDHWSFV